MIHPRTCTVASCLAILVRYLPGTNGLHYCYNLIPPCWTDIINFFRSLFNSANSMRIQCKFNANSMQIQ
ncbi:hypothetical protein FRACYDRAFT_268127 [Fragilariopsis cylindrus CCMP1102]|uniref:Secreted protein n=1 Tax=Fragilariopsis cylindrus CCMP1102 TaxID=635003 RepID=A0A1E7FP35_9STRA|nr:hypothetical protein FRACYDRAFT_268127 [Fragilariopsis cylindrus CCMP1102]|eukprot:OEU19930.1 hypothetical protein FRACYDRAFT_268127 [Fragilariopsis cylindrus CCMP1102]